MIERLPSFLDHEHDTGERGGPPLTSMLMSCLESVALTREERERLSAALDEPGIS